MAAIWHEPLTSDTDSNKPMIIVTDAIGKTKPLYSLSLVTKGVVANTGELSLSKEVNTNMDQMYISGTLKANPSSITNSFEFTVDSDLALISFNLYKNAEGVISLTNTNINDPASLLFNGTTSFNGKETIPTFPTGKWNSVTVGLSLSGQEALKRSRAGGAEMNNVIQEALTTALIAQTTPLIPQANRISQDHTNGGSIMAHIMNNNNFEIPKTAAAGNVFVSMGGARSDKSNEVSGTEDLRDKNSLDDCTVDPAECEKR
jgi:hypothetical protein